MIIFYLCIRNHLFFVFKFCIGMVDVLTKEQRRKCMSNIRSKNTRPEILVRKYLFSQGIRFRVNVKRLPGPPDIVERKNREE